MTAIFGIRRTLAQCPKEQNKQPRKSKDRPITACATSGDGNKTDSTIFNLPTTSIIAEQLQQLMSSHKPNAISASAIGLSSSIPQGIPHSSWTFDSGNIHHMTNDSPLFTSTSFPSTSISVMAASGTSMPLASIDTIISPTLTLSDVYYVP